MTRYTQHAAGWVFGLAALVLAPGCNPATTVRVVGQDGAPVASAEVYANNLRIGQTDANGVLAFPGGLAVGTALVARQQVFERPGYRQNHGPEHGGLSWTERVYLTSMGVREDGALDPLIVADPRVQQTLVLRTDNTLIGLHFLVSVIWDASNVELDQIGVQFREAGEYIYNATDGQIYFEQVDIVDDGAFWNDAEFHCNADTTVWPITTTVGGLLVPNLFGSVIELSTRRTDRGLGTFQVIDHEFGHLGFGLLDEYMPGVAFCTAHVNDADPLFGNGMPKASCVMFNPWKAGKFCSNRFENPHNFGSYEAANCWEAIANTFSDHTNPTAQWTLKTPDSRRGIVGRLPPGSTARWQPRINIDDRVFPGSNPLCQPFDVTARWGDGTAGANWPVTLAVGGRHIQEGLTDSNGLVKIVGAHAGDRIWMGTFGPWRDVIATGLNTCECRP